VPQINNNDIPINRNRQYAPIPRQYSRHNPTDFFLGAKIIGTILIILFVARFLFRYVFPIASVLLFDLQELFTIIFGPTLLITTFIKFRLWEKLSLRNYDISGLNGFHQFLLTAAFFLLFPGTLIFLNLLGSTLLFLQKNQDICFVVNVAMFILGFIIIKIDY